MSKGFIAFKYRDFRLYLLARFLTLAAHQMLVIGLSQRVYEITHNPIHLGYLGLALFLPKILLTLPAGHLADQFERRAIIACCRGAQVILAILFIGFALKDFSPLWGLYLLLFLTGSSNTFDGPASLAFVPDIIPKEDFGNAVAWNSSVFQSAFVVGPALAGLLYAAAGGIWPVLIGVLIMRVLAFVWIIQIRGRSVPEKPVGTSMKDVLAGLHFVRQQKVILGAITLDLFAVLFGGAVALMPVFANDILKVGASGLGFLRAAPALGAALMAFGMAHLPPLKRAGVTMFACVAGFGLATILFGLSTNFYFSLVCLFFLGAFDMISVIVRGVVVQVLTPQEMRGRVSAVNLVFIGASNELGEFESGLTASWFGTVPAVVLGGLGTLVVVALSFFKFPQLKNYGKLE